MGHYDLLLNPAHQAFQEAVESQAFVEGLLAWQGDHGALPLLEALFSIGGLSRNCSPANQPLHEECLVGGI